MIWTSGRKRYESTHVITPKYWPVHWRLLYVSQLYEDLGDSIAIKLVIQDQNPRCYDPTLLEAASLPDGLTDADIYDFTLTSK